jgi:ABC-2 type transport system ATP-binding protein
VAPATPPVERAPVVTLRGLTKVYDPTPRWMRAFARTHITTSVRALDGVDLTVGQGEICAIVGPNGAGKTTLFRIIVGLTNPTSGTGSVMGLDIERDSERIRQVVGWMPSEDRSLLMRATCMENLKLHGRLQGMPKNLLAERAALVLDAVNLSAQRDAVVASLSAGMKARLRLARALLPGPRVLILDEPTGAVDPIAAHGLLNLIMDLTKREELAVLLSSHRLEEIEALRSQAMLLDSGRIRYSGDLDELRREFDAPIVEFIFQTASEATGAAATLTGYGIEAFAEDAAVRCPRKADQTVGDIIAALGPAAAMVNHVNEVPMPLRDLIAKVYLASQGDGEPA